MAVADKDISTEAGLEPVGQHPLDCITAIVIPAHCGSTRLPNKPLLDETGKPLVYYAIDSALRATRAEDVGLVTDDTNLCKRAWGDHRGKLLAICSKRKAECGSHRVGAWLDKFEGWNTYGCVVNLQCDEPCIDPRDLDNLIAACALSEDICTLVTRLDTKDWTNANAVKAWTRGTTIVDFSREMLPDRPQISARLHIGAYAVPSRWFRRVFKDGRSPRAESQSLEQLTWLDGGLKIRAVDVKYSPDPLSINTPEDYARFVDLCKQQGECRDSR